MQSMQRGQGNVRRMQETSITKGLAACRTKAKSIAVQNNKGNVSAAQAAPGKMSQPRQHNADPKQPPGPAFASDHGQKRSFKDKADEDEAGETPIAKGTKHSQYNVPVTCYPRYNYTKTHSATITKNYEKLRQRISNPNEHDIDIVGRSSITLDIFEPLSKLLYLSAEDLVLRAPECCKIMTNLKKERSELCSSADSTVIHIKSVGSEGNGSFVSLCLSDEDKDNIAVKIGEILERDILRQMGKIYKNLEEDKRYIDTQHSNAKSQKAISIICSCSSDKGSCKSDACITEDIKRLQADIMSLFRRSKLPEDQKPKLRPGVKKEVDREVIDALKKTSRSIDHCGYNLDTLYIFVNEETPSEMLKANIEKKMIELCINNFRVVSSRVDEYTKHASGSGVAVKAYKAELSGTLTGFGRLEEHKTMVAIISKHLAVQSVDKQLIIQSKIQDLTSVTGVIMEQLCESPVYIDIALARIDKKDENLCDTMYRTEREKETLTGRLCDLGSDQMDGLPVYIWGNVTGLGRGKILIANIVPVNNEETHLLMIGDEEGKPFCREGDSGAMVCTDDPEGKNVLLIAVVMGAVPGVKGNYKSLKLKEGLEYLSKEIGENINMC